MSVLLEGLGRTQMVRCILGHIAALLPGDILARYYRLKGENVFTFQEVIAMEHPFQLGRNQKAYH